MPTELKEFWRWLLKKKLKDQYHYIVNSSGYGAKNLSINENKKPIEGTSSSRDSLSLPNYPKIDMLKIHDSIPMDSILEHVTESELSSVLNLGGNIE